MPDEKRILVVDDDSAIRTLLFTILRRRGLGVDTARNGVEALEKLGLPKPRCSILRGLTPNGPKGTCKALNGRARTTW